MTAPKLRFKEFIGDWANVNLDKVSKVFDGTHQTPTYVESGIKFVSVENISAPYESGKFITEEAFEKDFKNKPQRNDILMTRITAGEIGATAIVDDREPLAYYVSLALIRPKSQVNTLYLNQYIGTPFFKKELHKRIIHVAFPKKINLGDINECLVAIPGEFQEQIKIATFLSAVDEKISQLSQKLHLLGQYKQGMMQKLFSQQLRFKADDGSEFREWKTEKIGNITETIFGYPFDSKDMVDDSNGISLMRGINIGERHIRHTPELDRFFIKNPSKLEKYFVRENDIVLSMDGSKVGRNAAFVSRKDANSLLVQRVCILRENTFSNIKYIYQWIISNHFHRYVDQVKTSSGIPHISGKQIQEYEIDYPPLEEQTKIANFLSAIDQKIDVTTEQLEQAKLWKKGLLQQMFV